MSKRLNVLFVAAWYPVEATPYQGTFIREHAKAVSSFADVHVVFLSFEKGGALPSISIEHTKISDSFHFHHVKITSPVRRFGLHDALVKKAYAKVLKAASADAPIDLIHLNVRSVYTRLVPELPALQEVPMVLSEHFSFYHTGIYKLPEEEQAAQKSAISAWMRLPQLKKIMPVSQQLGNVLVENFGAREEQIVVVPNIASNEFSFAPKTESPTIRVALVAVWAAPKNPLLFLKVLTLIDPQLRARLCIDWIGNGPQLDAIESYQKEHLPELNCTFHGFQQKAFINATLQQADFLVHPTDAENLPTVIIESLVCGTPVLSHAVNGIPEMIDQSNGMLCAPKSEKALLEAFERMCNDYTSYDHKMIAENAGNKYSKGAVANQIEQVYRSVLK